MTDIPSTSLTVEGTRKQTATSRDAHPGGGKSDEMRKLGLVRRRAKGLDDIPTSVGRSKKKKKKKGP